jgi:LPXTG-motif cell wall-anchored protein
MASSPKLTLLIAATAALALALTSGASAAQPTIGLGTASTFAVLAGAGITNTGATTASGTNGGNFGSSPNAAFTGSTLVTTTGTKYLSAVPQTASAQIDLTTAYNDAAGRTPVTTIASDLGGQTLKQGVYNSASSIGLTGTLTLDGENDPAAVFIFQAGSTLTTATSSRVLLINGAQPCNVFWQVGSSATFGTTSDFTGSVLALTSITANNNATFKGQLLARNGAVTLDSNTIVNDRCAAVATATPTPTATPTATASPSATPLEVTETGGQLPDTDSSNWLAPLATGFFLMAIGTAGYLLRKKLR